MRFLLKCKLLLVAASMLPVLGVGCSTNFRDAVLSGAIDFVSGSVTEILNQLLPIAEAVAST